MCLVHGFIPTRFCALCDGMSSCDQQERRTHRCRDCCEHCCNRCCFHGRHPTHLCATCCSGAQTIRWALALNRIWREYAVFSDTSGAAPGVLPKDGRTSAAALLWMQISYGGRPRHVCLRTKREALQYPCMATISRRLDPRWSLIGLRLPSELIMNSRWGDA